MPPGRQIGATIAVTSGSTGRTLRDVSRCRNLSRSAPADGCPLQGDGAADPAGVPDRWVPSTSRRRAPCRRDRARLRTPTPRSPRRCAAVTARASATSVRRPDGGRPELGQPRTGPEEAALVASDEVSGLQGAQQPECGARRKIDTARAVGQTDCPLGADLGEQAERAFDGAGRRGCRCCGGGNHGCDGLRVRLSVSPNGRALPSSETVAQSEAPSKRSRPVRDIPVAVP